MSFPAQIGRYQIVGHLARGGMAEILLGKLVGPSGFERPVVIKRILPHLAKRESFVDMFLDEARLVARIRHPNVVTVHELGRQDDELFMVMELLEGESVLSLLRRARKRAQGLDRVLSAHIVAQAAAGLHAAHELKDDEGRPLRLVHRDVSPHNIFVTYDGNVKLLDFGIAKADERNTDTEAGQVKGKFPYMSPEQCLARPLDRRSDIFSLGTVLYEMTTGQRLFSRDSSLETARAILDEPIPAPTRIDPGYPEALETICLTALERDPDARYQTAAQMRRELLLAMRELAFDGLPDEALAQQMQTLFDDRIDQKSELLRRVSSGSEITNVPEAEVDVSVELPTVHGQANRVSPATPMTASSVQGAGQEPRRSSRPFLLLLAALVLGGGIGAVLVSTMGDGSVETAAPAGAAPPGETTSAEDREEAGSETASTDATEASSSEAEPEVGPLVEAHEAANDAPPAPVELRITTTPPGALVRIDGETHGRSPAVIALAGGDEPVTVSLERPGFVTLTRDVVPADEPELRVTLERAAPARPRSGTRPSRSGMQRADESEATPMTESPFRRFN